MQQDVERFEAEVAEVCGIINAATGRLVRLIASALAAGGWEGDGIRSPEHWVSWKCGVSCGRARKLIAMARRLPDLPETRAALDAGELSEDQTAVVCRHTPARNDAEVAGLARFATVSQLRRVLTNYAWVEPARPPKAKEPRRVSFGYAGEGSWRLSAVLPADEGALIEAALGAQRQRLFGDDPTVTWADALVALASERPARDRNVVLVHVQADDDGRPRGHLHVGPGLPDSVRRQVGCDGRTRAVIEREGKAISVGRTRRIVPDRTRMAVEERDRGCRIPGCDRIRWLECHHIRHWEDGGPTDTGNLIALCGRHHRLHHQGQLGISGDADDPDGLVFTDSGGQPLAAAGQPRPPGEMPPGNWSHPTGERLQSKWVCFTGRAPA